jgi:SpoVK/Ycf46/Vps4 family AAA+-type ATPase
VLVQGPLPPSLVHLTWPVLPGFSFGAKCWGVCLVSGLRPVRFNTDAFDRLVMAESRKRLIKALVLSHREGAGTTSTSTVPAVRRGTDVIAGKGEGTIFLLYGPPGVGKTLTAEAIAELLRVPLYVVSFGELGTTPETLEERLLDVLDLCAPWGALVLIDEAEMLLEARGQGDIVRNAMVCSMLRLLEYYSGILFLTTNRVRSLDPAFQSRVQCALKYAPLDAGSRGQIWQDVLRHCPLPVEATVDVAALALHALNGRQIKNSVQLAVALAQSEARDAGFAIGNAPGGVEAEEALEGQAPSQPLGPLRPVLCQRHLDATVEITTAFISETNITDSAW